jgi:hypothetical protein
VHLLQIKQADKTKYLLIIHNNVLTELHHRILINNNNLGENDTNNIFGLGRVKDSDKVPAIKYLGVYFDENLNFKYRINYLQKKLSHALYSL